jgi:hypothetical protein
MASMPTSDRLLFWHAAALLCLVCNAGLQLCSAQAVPYPEQLLRNAADSCQFGVYATGSSGAIMQAHEAIAESTYKSLSLDFQLPIASAVMQAIGCASESVDGFSHPFKTTLVEGEAFPKPFFIPKLGNLPAGGIPKSDLGQLHTQGTLKGLPFRLFSRMTAMSCLNGTQSNEACQHRTTIICADTGQFFNDLASGNLSGLLELTGGCYQLAMEWQVPFAAGSTNAGSAWTNVMPHEIWKSLVVNTTQEVDLLNQAAVEATAPGFREYVLISVNPLLSRIPPCNSSRMYAARTQAMANLQAFQDVIATPESSDGPAANVSWQLLQLPSASELQAALTLRACQYTNATKSLLQACPLSAAEIKDLVDASPRPTGSFCFFESPLASAEVVQETVARTAQTVAGVAGETDLASAITTLQTAALDRCPSTSFTTLLLTVSSVGIAVVTCEKNHVKRGIERMTTQASKAASLCTLTGSVQIQRIVCTLVAYTIYIGVSLGIATPAIAIVVTNLMYSKASFTATVLAYSADVSTVPQLELTLTETVKLLYKPRNFLVSVLVGISLCVLSLIWGLSQGMAACKASQSDEVTSETNLLPDKSGPDSAFLRTCWSTPETGQLRQAWRDRLAGGIV